MGTLSPSPFAPKEPCRAEVAEEMTLLTGTVGDLSVTDGTVNLLTAMERKLIASGVNGGVETFASSGAAASMGAMDGNEFVQHFGCRLGNSLLIGTFEDIGFEEGDEVTAVVTKIDDGSFFAHAVLRTNDQMLWMPHSINRGRYAIAIWITKFLGSIAIVGLAFLLVVHSFIPAFDSRLELIAHFTPALLLVGGFMTYRSNTGEALYAEEILKAVGFDSPWRVNLAPFSIARLHAGSSYQTYDLGSAMTAYGQRRPRPQV